MNGIVASELGLLYPRSRVREFRRGSAGLHCLFEALRDLRGPGEIVVPNLCCETVALAARYAGHIVKFADVDPDRFCVTPKSVGDVIGPLTRAVVIVHLFGLTVEAGGFNEMRAAHPQVVFVEDIAHAAGGCDVLGREVGTGFDHVMFSFSKSKIIGGEGGAIVSHRNDEVTVRVHEGDIATEVVDGDPLLALSLRNFVHAIADLHRAGSNGAANDFVPDFWDRYRSVVATEGPILDPGKAVADLRDRVWIRDRRRNCVERYSDAIRHPAFWAPEFGSAETCWRFPLIAETPVLCRRATDMLRCESIHASNHYFALNRLFGGDNLPESEFISDRVLNLWVDDSITELEIAATARILNSL